MAKVHVIARFVAHEGSENQFGALLQGMVVPTRSESGCELYELCQSDSRERFYLCETWASQAALDQHMATPHFKRLEQTGRKLVSEPFGVNIVKRILTGAAAAGHSLGVPSAAPETRVLPSPKLISHFMQASCQEA